MSFAGANRFEAGDGLRAKILNAKTGCVTFERRGGISRGRLKARTEELLQAADVLRGPAHVALVGGGVADLDLVHRGLLLAVVWDKERAFLVDAAFGIARDDVILQGNEAAVGHLANPFRVDGGGEGRVQGWRNGDTTKPFDGAAVGRMLRRLRLQDFLRAGGRKQQRKGCNGKKQSNSLHDSPQG
jgi:hypothetical protein